MRKTPTQAQVFEKISQRLGTKDLPIVAGPNVFLLKEYQLAAGIGECNAHARMRRLEADGVVRRVKTRRNGSTLLAWEYIERG